MIFCRIPYICDVRWDARQSMGWLSGGPRARGELATALTKVGKTFHIRHSETSQTELARQDHVDYLFHRLWSLIWLLLRAR